MKSEKLLLAFNYVEDKYLELTEKGTRKKISLRKRTFILIAAILSISLLSVTAIAKLPSALQYLRQIDSEDTAVYDAAEEANKDRVPEPVDLPQMKDASLIVNQKYYDGETILLGLDVKAVAGEPSVGFEPDEALMKQIQVFGRVNPASAAPETYDEIPYPRYARNVAELLKMILTPEQYQKLQKHMEETGHCCVVIREAYVGDGIDVNGTDMMDTYDANTNAYAGILEGSTPAGEAIRLEPLPENARNQDTVTVELNIKSGLRYYYLDMEGHGYSYYSQTDSVPAQITITNSEKQ